MEDYKIYMFLLVICASLLRISIEEDLFSKQDFETVSFAHEICQLETLSSTNFSTFYPVDKFNDGNGQINFLVRFMGVADGHILLSANASEEQGRSGGYIIQLGGYNNKISEIKRQNQVEFRINSQGILSDQQYRGFFIRYNSNAGELAVLSEGSEIPLLHIRDSNPLQVRYFAFATWIARIVKVAFNCQPKDMYSHVAESFPNLTSSTRKISIYYLCCRLQHCLI